MKKLTEELKQITYFYNYERKQEQLGWQAPVEYENYIGTQSEKQIPVKRLYDFEDLKNKGFGGIVGQKYNQRRAPKSFSAPKYNTFTRARLFLGRLLPSRACLRLILHS